MPTHTCLTLPNRSAAVAAGLLVLATASPALGAIKTRWPRQIAPAFIEPLGKFTAEVEGPAGLPTSPTSWRATLGNELRRWGTTVESVTYGPLTASSRSGYKLVINPVDQVPPELLDLTITGPGTQGEAVSKSAVSVAVDLETSFYILHITDEHAWLGGGRGAAAPATSSQRSRV